MCLQDFGLEIDYSVDPPNFKKLEREHIEKETAAFIAAGGHITRLEIGDSKWKGLRVETINCKIGRRKKMLFRTASGERLSYLNDLVYE